MAVDRLGRPLRDDPYRGNVRVYSASNITLSGLQTIDGVTLESGDRVLCNGQTTTPQNGIYVASNGVWSRSRDLSSSDDFTGPIIVTVEEGTTYRNTFWHMLPSTTITVGTDAVSFTSGYPAALIGDDSITDAKLRESAGLSVIGRSANTTGNPADITGTDGQVLRVVGTTLGFGDVLAPMPPLPLPYRSTAIIVGDSTAQQNDVGSLLSAGLPNYCSRSAEGQFRFAEAMSRRLRMPQFWEPAEGDSGKFTAGHNLAFASETSADVYKRLHSALRKYRPQIVFAGYGINDLVAVDATGAFTIAQDELIAEVCSQYGAYLVLIGPQPRSVPGLTYPVTIIPDPGWAPGDPKYAGRLAIIAARTAQAAASNGRVRYIDTDPYLASGDQWIPVMTSDGVHPSFFASQPVGEAVSDIIEEMVEDSGGYSWVGNPASYNIIDGSLAGTGGILGTNAIGAVADGWTLTAAGVGGSITVQGFKGTLNGYTAQQLAFTLGGTADTEEFRFALTAGFLKPNVPAGTMLELSMLVAYSGNAFQQITPVLTSYDGLNPIFESAGWKNLTPTLFKLNSTGVPLPAFIELVTHPVPVEAFTDSFGVRLDVNLTAVGSSGTNYVQVAAPIVRPVRTINSGKI